MKSIPVAVLTVAIAMTPVEVLLDTLLGLVCSLLPLPLLCG
jgi:hypothetical protein